MPKTTVLNPPRRKKINKYKKLTPTIKKNMRKQKLSNGWPMDKIARRNRVRIGIVNAFFIREEIMRLPVLKGYITRRLNKIVKSRRKAQRQKLYADLKWSINNLYYHAKLCRTELETLIEMDQPEKSKKKK